MEQPLQRYARQTILPQVGLSGQEKLLKSSVSVVGCGGLGCTIAQILVRAGVGRVIIRDDERVEIENLHRQILFDERDLGRSKVQAAAAKLSAINSQVEIRALDERVTAENVRSVFDEADLVVDATDNLATRYLLNESAVRMERSWIYGGCVGTEGTIMVIRSGGGACLACIFGPAEASDLQPAGGKFPILPTAPVVVGALQANEVLKYLLAPDNTCGSRYICIDLWQTRVRASEVLGRVSSCVVCGRVEQ